MVTVAMMLTAPSGFASHQDEDLFLRGEITRVQQDRDNQGRWETGDRLDFDFDLDDARESNRFVGDGEAECRVTDVEFGELEEADCDVEIDHVDGRLFLEGDFRDDDAFEGEQVLRFRVEDGTRHFDDDEGDAFVLHRGRLHRRRPGPPEP